MDDGSDSSFLETKIFNRADPDDPVTVGFCAIVGWGVVNVAF